MSRRDVDPTELFRRHLVAEPSSATPTPKEVQIAMGRRRELQDWDALTNHSQSQAAQTLKLPAHFRKFQQSVKASRQAKGPKFESSGDEDDEGDRILIASDSDDSGEEEKVKLTQRPAARGAAPTLSEEEDEPMSDLLNLLADDKEDDREEQRAPFRETRDGKKVSFRVDPGELKTRPQGPALASEPMPKKRSLPVTFANEPPKRVALSAPVRPALPELGPSPSPSSSAAARPMPVTLVENGDIRRTPLHCKWACPCPRSSVLHTYWSQLDMVNHIITDHCGVVRSGMSHLRRFRCQWGACDFSDLPEREFVLHLAAHFKEPSPTS